jgi:hypothetical protein
VCFSCTVSMRLEPVLGSAAQSDRRAACVVAGGMPGRQGGVSGEAPAFAGGGSAGLGEIGRSESPHNTAMRPWPRRGAGSTTRSEGRGAALKMVIEPIPRVRPLAGPRTGFETQFRPGSYGFRPGRGCKSLPSRKRGIK